MNNDFFLNKTGLTPTATGRESIAGALAWLRAERGAVSCTIVILMSDAINAECILHADGRLEITPAAKASHDTALILALRRWRDARDGAVSPEALSSARDPITPRGGSLPQRPTPAAVPRRWWAVEGDTVVSIFAGPGNAPTGVVERLVAIRALPYARVRWSNGTIGRHSISASHGGAAMRINFTGSVDVETRQRRRPHDHRRARPRSQREPDRDAPGRLGDRRFHQPLQVSVGSGAGLGARRGARRAARKTASALARIVDPPGCSECLRLQNGTRHRGVPGRGRVARLR